MNVYILQVMSILRQAYCSPKYLYYLLPGQEKKVREPDGSLRKEVLVPNIAEFEKRWHEAVDALESRDRSAPTSSGVRRHLISISAVRFDPAGLCGRSGRGSGTTCQSPARRSAEASALVLGQRIQQPLFRLGRVHERAGLPGPEELVRRPTRRSPR